MYWQLTDQQRATIARHTAGGLTPEQATKLVVPMLRNHDLNVHLHTGLVTLFQPRPRALGYGERVAVSRHDADGYTPVRRFASLSARRRAQALIERAKRERAA